jgi:nitrite reductase/ring-hydroxylating ferredoxin subunit
MPTFYRALPSAELAEGRLLGVEIAGRDILLVRTAAGLHALDNRCNHGTARLSEGRLRGIRVICPLHGASFDCRSGALLGAPATAPQCAYPTRVVDDWIEVGLEP